MQRHPFGVTLGLLLTFALAPIAKAEPAPITEEEAHAIGVDAYLYFYPLVTMDLTRLQSTNVEPGKEPFNPTAEMRTVVRPNHATRVDRHGRRRLHAHRRTHPLCLDHRSNPDKRACRL